MRKSKRENRRQRKQAEKRKQAAITIGAVVLAVAALAFILWRSNLPAEPLAGEDVLAVGETVYAQNCASCHGSEGEGHGSVTEAPALDDSEHAWHHPDQDLFTVIASGGPNMPGFSDSLDHDQIVAVIRYFQAWWTADQAATQQERSAPDPLR